MGDVAMQAPRIGGQAPHSPQGVVHTLDIYIHKTEIEPFLQGSISVLWM